MWEKKSNSRRMRSTPRGSTNPRTKKKQRSGPKDEAIGISIRRKERRNESLPSEEIETTMTIEMGEGRGEETGAIEKSKNLQVE